MELVFSVMHLKIRCGYANKQSKRCAILYLNLYKAMRSEAAISGPKPHKSSGPGMPNCPKLMEPGEVGDSPPLY